MQCAVRLYLIGLSALAFLRCSTESDHSDFFYRDLPIVRGTDSDPSQDGVAKMITLNKDGNTFGVCTLSMIAPNLGLTARHCVSTKSKGAIGCDENGIGEEGSQFLADHDPQTTFLYTGAAEAPIRKPVARGVRYFYPKGGVCGEDIALVLFDRNISVPMAKMRFSPVTQGEKVSVVGWGRTEKTEDPPVRQRKDNLTIAAIGPSPLRGVYDASGTIVDTEPAIPPKMFQIHAESVCQGDSGGPVLDANGAIVGITSFGGGPKVDAGPADGCTGDKARFYFTQIAPYQQLIAQALQEAGHPSDTLAPPPDLSFPAPNGTDPPSAPASQDLGGSSCSTAGAPSGQIDWFLLVPLIRLLRKKSSSF